MYFYIPSQEWVNVGECVSLTSSELLVIDINNCYSQIQQEVHLLKMRLTEHSCHYYC